MAEEEGLSYRCALRVCSEQAPVRPLDLRTSEPNQLSHQEEKWPDKCLTNSLLAEEEGFEPSHRISPI